jgi:hypothetical protein
VVAPESHDRDGALGVRQQRRRQAAAGRPALALPHRASLLLSPSPPPPPPPEFGPMQQPRSERGGGGVLFRFVLCLLFSLVVVVSCPCLLQNWLEIQSFWNNSCGSLSSFVFSFQHCFIQSYAGCIIYASKYDRIFLIRERAREAIPYTPYNTFV